MELSRTAIGLDIGGTHVRCARVEADGMVQAHLRRPTARRAELLLDDVLDLIARLRVPGTAAVGVGVPGRVDAKRRKVLSGGYVDLSTLQFVQEIEQAVGLPVIVENDAAMALLAEQAFGNAKGRTNVVLLTVGTGIGGAVLEHGRLMRGRRSAGQLGHMILDPDGQSCLCGQRGCLETMVAGPALARLLEQEGFSGAASVLDLLSRPSDPSSVRVLERWARPLWQAISSLTALFDPEALLLGGGLGQAALAALNRLPPPGGHWFTPTIQAAGLGDEAGMVGAALASLAALATARKRAILVNGVPASGKSAVATELAKALGWSYLSLDTVKQPFLDALPPGDRLFNRTLGRASYHALFDIMRDAADGTSFVVDAWFGFQPQDVLLQGLTRSGVSEVAEVWCEAPPDEIGRRYAERVPVRGQGHPGLAYVPELIELASRAVPLSLGPLLRVDTSGPVNLEAVAAWVRSSLASRTEL